MNEFIFARPAQFDLAKIFDCGQSFRFAPCTFSDTVSVGCAFEGVAYGRYLCVSQQADTVTARYTGTRDDDAFVLRYFDIQTDYDAVLQTFCGDPVLMRAAKLSHGIRILRQEPWEALCSFIISQNNNIPRIGKIIRTLSETYGEKVYTSENGQPFYTFPTAQALKKAGTDALYALKTGFRAGYLYDAARTVSENPFFLTETAGLTTPEAAEKLKQIKGVGNKVAACTLLFGFARHDAFPVDVWVKRALEEYYPDGLTPPLSGPYAGIAQQILFYRRRYTE